MATDTAPFETLQDIRKMMEKSSRFISLSGWSGIAAGICGLIGAFMAHMVIDDGATYGTGRTIENPSYLLTLVGIAIVVFCSAFISAFFFTWLRSRRTGTPIWGTTAKRLLWNGLLPMITGGLLILRLLHDKNYVLIAPCALLFYGLALVNGSKYTVGEIRYAGYLEILLGAIGLCFPWHGLLLWTLGFGVVHIVYGAIMWWKYERLTGAQE